MRFRVKFELLFPAILSVVFVSCAPSTPDVRISARPSIYQALPEKQKELVKQGKVEKGMSTDAVYLAWGRPSREYEGSDGSATTLRWDYAGTKPVIDSSFYGGYGYPGYGWYGRYPYSRLGYSQAINYVPYRRATVLFRNGKVSSWERSR